MIPVLTPDQMQRADRAAIEQYSIPSLVLMENAARSAGEIIAKWYKLDGESIVILCGHGNNGGDGFALARHLWEKSSITIVFCGDTSHMTGETAVNYAACRALGMPIIEWDESHARVLPSNPGIIIDALLGIGAHGAPREPLASLLTWANQQHSVRIALDIPSGLDAARGVAYNPCFRADLTITMGALKTGLLRNDGPDYCGRVEVAHIGIPGFVLDNLATTWCVDVEDLRHIYRQRQLRTTKFDYGRVLIVAGSHAMPGAAALCANAAVAAGAGLVELLSPTIHPTLFPEVMPYQYCGHFLDADALPLLDERIERATTVVIGPGLGNHAKTVAAVQTILARCRGTKPLILDADALRAIDATTPLNGVTITPHRGELARILGRSVADVAHDAHERAQQLSIATGATVVFKDFPVQISNRERTYWMTTYNPALASGGMGDVLTGIIAALWAQGYTQFEAAWMGVLIHAMAGRIAAEQHGELATRATHVIAALSSVSQMLGTIR